jgi:hypothetical protein
MPRKNRPHDQAARGQGVAASNSTHGMSISELFPEGVPTDKELSEQMITELQLIQSNPTDTDIVVAACIFLTKCCSLPTCKHVRYAQTSGAFDILHNALKSSMHIDEVQSRICSVLGLLCRDRPPSPKIPTADLTATIIETMTRHLRNKIIQASCMGLIACFTSRIHSWTIADVRHVLGQKRVFAAVMASMRAHPHDTAVQHNAFQILRHVYESQEDVNQRLQSAGVVSVILAAMQFFLQPPDDALLCWIQSWYCHITASWLGGFSGTRCTKVKK